MAEACCSLWTAEEVKEDMLSRGSENTKKKNKMQKQKLQIFLTTSIEISWNQGSSSLSTEQASNVDYKELIVG